MHNSFIDHHVVVAPVGCVADHLGADESVFRLHDGIVPDIDLGIGQVDGLWHPGMQRSILFSEDEVGPSQV